MSIPQAVTEVWEELPTLLGPRFSKIQPKLLELLLKIKSTDGDEQKRDFMRQLLDVIRAEDRLLLAVREKAREIGQGGYRHSPTGLTPRVWAARLLYRIIDYIAKPAVTYQARVIAPPNPQTGEAITVSVHVEPPDDTITDAIPLDLFPGQKLTIHIHTNPDDLEIIGPDSYEYTITEVQDDLEARFKLRCRRAGPMVFTVDFAQAGRHLARIPYRLSVGSPENKGKNHTIKANVSTANDWVQPVDWRLWVYVHRLAGGHCRLAYVLSSPSGKGPHIFKARSRMLHLENCLAPLLERLSRVRTGRGGLEETRSMPLVRRELAILGRKLYKLLFPPELQITYDKYRHKIRTIEITSDEHWIPWEIIKPFRQGGGGFDDPMLVERFVVSRWLAISACSPGVIPVARFAIITTGGDSLCGEVLNERGTLKNMLEVEGKFKDIGPEESNVADVLKLVEGRTVELLHFAGHGDEQFLLLGFDRKLRVEELANLAPPTTNKAGPLVFMNLCRANRIPSGADDAITWADAWLGHHQCSAFVGTSWDVSDILAAHFSKTFYRLLLQGQTLGRAFRLARYCAKRRGRRTGDPSWAAFCLFGHPNATLERQIYSE